MYNKEGSRGTVRSPARGRLLPAAIFPSGTKKWYQNNKCHNDDRDERGKLLPAIIKSDGTFEWYIGGIKIQNN